MLGKELRKAREAAGITQEELAFRADISRNYVSMLEREIKSPTVQLFLRICKAIGVKASTIIARVER